ncbi:uncharacterized protein LOC135482111 [Liolophura sinensis]|uniref:uncharacterized protein LOC135482111 n=1 Tax=Liolophura sinensis TaxID=3198878 RepID=UPI0031586BBD
MAYSLKILDNTQTPTDTAKFGESVFLEVSMDATDADEQGVQVESCTVISGTARLPIIENFCVVPDKALVFQLGGFVSSKTRATFPITVFGLEGSQSTLLSFECVVKVCPSPCDGLNCPATPAGKRKRRAAGDEPTQDKSLKMATQIQVLPIGVPISGSQTGQQDSNSMTCMQSLGFIVTVAVLSVLLIVAMVTVVFMFTTRRREVQKQGA